MDNSFLLEMREGAVELITEFGSKCTVKTFDGKTSHCIGALVSSKSSDSLDRGNDFITGTQRIGFVTGTKDVVPEEGDTVAWKQGTYMITDVKEIGIDDNPKNQVAFRLILKV